MDIHLFVTEWHLFSDYDYDNDNDNDYNSDPDFDKLKCDCLPAYAIPIDTIAEIIIYLIKFYSQARESRVAEGQPNTGLHKSLESHTRKAYEGIRKMLFHNEIVPGQKISYRDLSERLGMSQTPVIQALKWLEFQQLVRHEPNRGYYTAPINLKEVEEIYELRELIELDLLGKTMKRIDSGDLNRLREALEAHLKAAREIYLYDRLLKDMEFHLTLASLSHCRIQQQILKNLFDLLYLKYGGKFLFSTSMESADCDHKDLFECIRNQNAAGAGQVLARHIQRVKKHVLHGVEKMIAATRL
jgi:DNA-binding GntR family transcriptional regulator